MHVGEFVRPSKYILAFALCVLSLGIGRSVSAAEPSGACYTQPATGAHDWSGPFTVTLNHCAALAAEQTTNNQDGVSYARWQDYEIQAYSDGSFELVENASVVSRKYWSVERLAEDVSEDIDQFWQRVFEQHEWDYKSPKNVQGYTRRIRTACGSAVPNNAFYCNRSHSIYYDLNLLQRQFDTVGDFAPVTVIAHEWGHAIQAQITQTQTIHYNIEAELQADCFAGAYTRDAETREKLEAGDVEEATDFLFKVGDRRSRPWTDPRAHGTPKQRTESFTKGYEKGVDACLL